MVKRARCNEGESVGHSNYADRKKNVPKFFKEDWESFIEMCSTHEAQEKSKLGKAARQAMRYLHTFSRNGHARVADELRRENPDKEITCMDVWLETHTKKYGFAFCKETEKVRRIHENNPSFAQGHLH